MNEKVVQSEEKIFGNTLGRGLNHFDKVLANLSGNKISGKEAFRLYDTYGFPLDLTQLLARENGISVDDKGFKSEMKEQRQRAKSSAKFTHQVEDLDWIKVLEEESFDFVGYETTKSKSQILRYSAQKDQFLVVLNTSPFYAESGGQIGDSGTIKGKGVDLIVDDGHAVSVYLGYSLLNISKILTKFIPLSFLLAVFLTILKFEDESEFMILWTAGLNKIRVVNFFLNVSFLVTVIQIVLASFVNPEVLNYSRSLIRSSNLDFISSMIKTNQFNDTVEGLTIYVEEKDETDDGKKATASKQKQVRIRIRTRKKGKESWW